MSNTETASSNAVNRLETVADYFIILSNETQNLLSNLKLQKMVYYAQAWHLAICEVPLFETDFEAWVHGPVIPKLYEDFKRFSWRPIDVDYGERTSEQVLSEFATESQQVLLDVTDAYFGYTAFELEQMTPRQTPWLEARGDLPEDAISKSVISKDTMRRYYQQLLDKAEETE